MLEILLTSIGLVLIVEGVLYFFVANNLNKLFKTLSTIKPQTIKNIENTLCSFNSIAISQLRRSIAACATPYPTSKR